MIHMRTFHLSILFAFTSLLISCSPGADTGSIENWSVLYNQSDSIKTAIQNRSWKPIKLPFMIKAPYLPQKKFNYLWLRSSFILHGDALKYYGIIPGIIYHTDTVYINNRLIGEHREEELHSVNFPRHYKIEKGILKNGTNEILMRIGIYGREYGGVPGDIYLLTREDFYFQKIINELLYQQIPLGIVILLIGHVIFNLLFFLWRRKDIANLYSAAICLSWIIYILMLFSPYQPFSIDFRITFLWSCLSLLPIFFTLFVQAYYKIYLPFYNRIIIPILITITAVILFFQDTTSDYYPGRILGIAAMALFSPAFYYLFYRIHKLKPSNVIYIYIIFGVFPGCFIVWDVINYLWIFHNPPLSHTYTLPIFIIGLMMLIIHKSIRNEIDLEILYSQLKKTSDDKKQIITNTTEEKLDEVLEFIKLNFKSDISREGLANAMGMSSDHMSRSFKANFGKRINDYINELRIKEAASKLKDTEDKITDIAFSVGFESIPTFNRAFLKVMDTTPTEYRIYHSD